MWCASVRRLIINRFCQRDPHMQSHAWVQKMWANSPNPEKQTVTTRTLQTPSRRLDPHEFSIHRKNTWKTDRKNREDRTNGKERRQREMRQWLKKKITASHVMNKNLRNEHFQKSRGWLRLERMKRKWRTKDKSNKVKYVCNITHTRWNRERKKRNETKNKGKKVQKRDFRRRTC